MSEMLGNQYFLSRKYSEAINELEETLQKYPTNKSAKKKLIICYVKTGKIFTALGLFEELVMEDVDCIINTDPILDDCPCPEIIYEIENMVAYQDENEKAVALGMLWLYCDLDSSINHFEIIAGKNERIEKIIRLLKTKTKQIQR